MARPGILVTLLAATLRVALVQLAGGTALLALLLLAYTAKRALGIDLVPGIDMLPDEEVEALLVTLAGG